MYIPDYWFSIDFIEIDIYIEMIHVLGELRVIRGDMDLFIAVSKSILGRK